MEDITSHSGPWIGLSIQDGTRISEKITLRFSGPKFSGEGNDKDGLFNLEGEYDPEDQWVNITRAYTVAPQNPSQVGYPFIYIGKWDGSMVSGRWMMSTIPSYGGTFEMWPEREELSMDMALEDALQRLVHSEPMR